MTILATNIAKEVSVLTACPHPNDLDRRRIQRALRERTRYKYVSPKVVSDSEGYLVRSPCCSRKVDPEGGEIDIARIEYQVGGFWRLFHKNDETCRWQLHSEYLSLLALLARLVADPKREFWR